MDNFGNIKSHSGCESKPQEEGPIDSRFYVRKEFFLQVANRMEAIFPGLVYNILVIVRV